MWLTMMSEHSSYDLIVVGGGIAGSAAALRAAQYHLHTCWIYGDKKTASASRSKWVYNVDNMIGIHEGVVKEQLLRELSEPADEPLRRRLSETHVHISGQAILENTRARIEADYAKFVTIIDTAATSATKEGEDFVVTVGYERVRSKYLALATGVMDRQPSIKKERGGKVIDSIHWIYPFANRETILYCIRCEGHLTREKEVAVIGSTEQVAQLAFMLHERYNVPVTILTNGEVLRVPDETHSLMERYRIAVYSSRITDVIGEGKGKLRKFILEDGSELDVQYALVAMGLHRVYNDLAVQLGAELVEGNKPIEIRHVKVNQKSETSVPNLFALGDMAMRGDEIVMKQIYTAQEYAVRAVDTLDSRRRRVRRKAE